MYSIVNSVQFGEVMEKSLLKKIDLENGLTVEIHDISRKLVGDRWYVGFVAHIEIPLKGLFSEKPNSSGIGFQNLQDILGEAIIFKQKCDRHFIDEKEKDAFLSRLIDDFLSSTLSYFSHTDFARKYVLKEYKKQLARVSWQKDENNK